MPLPTDIIFIHGLEADCVIGVWEWERRIRQRIVIDLDLAADIRRAARTDDLADTISYKDIAKSVTDLATSSSYHLVETLAEHIARLLVEDHGIGWCRVRVNKYGAVTGAGDVGVMIERGAGVD